MDPGLYIVGTPIGNLQDISQRALEVLKGVDHVMAEDTRHTRKLLTHYDISVPMSSAHKFNEASKTDYVLDLIRGGAAVALVSDSGMPGISDPGSRLVHACHDAELPVVIIPGPSAVVSAVAMSGFGGDRFHFEGFLSPKGATRKRQLAALSDTNCAVVLFESPHRLIKLLTDMDEVMGDRPIFMGRELTKKFEQGLRGTAAEIRQAFDGRSVKGELVLVIAPAKKIAASGKRKA